MEVMFYLGSLSLSCEILWGPSTVDAVTSDGVGALPSPNLGAKMFGAEADNMDGFFVAPLPCCKAKRWLSGMDDNTESADGGAADRQLGAVTSGAETLLSLKSQGAFHSQPKP